MAAKRGRPPKHAKEIREAAIHAVNVLHRTSADVSREIGVNESVVRTWAAKAKNAAAQVIPPTPEAPEEPPAQDEPLQPTGDSIVDARAIQARLFAAAEAAERIGNSAEARKSYQEAVKLSGVIARLERERDREHGTVITPEDIAKARKSLQDQIDALRRRPLLCANCHRELSLAIAQKEKES